MPDTPQKSPTDLEWDPVYLHARKEAWLILGVWFLAMLWTLPVSYFNGFDSQVDIEQVTFIWGMPSWVFWGIGLPWMVANLITIWFCFCYFSTDDLEPPESNENSANQETAGDA
jgi:hypothetical protein